MKSVPITLVVNGAERRVEVPSRELLADCLRDRLGLTGTHLGCEHGVCGACTVLVDGRSVRSCLTLAVQADGSQIATVEGLASQDGELHPIQEAFSAHHALQCGFCTPGLLMSCLELLQSRKGLSGGEVREHLSGNICRCTGYDGITKAALAADTQWHRELAEPDDNERATTWS